MQLIMNADCNKYGTLVKDYNREYIGGINKYPKTLQEAYNLQPAKGMEQAREDKSKVYIQDWSIIQHCKRRG